MSTEFYNRNWRMPKSSNSSKVSNYSMEFDGLFEYIDLGNDSILDFYNKEMSFSLWLNTGSTGLEGVFGDCNSAGTVLQYSIDTNRTANKITFLSIPGLSSPYLVSNIDITTNTWYHVVITKSGSSANWLYTMYINGSSANGGTANGTQEATSITSISIGKFGALPSSAGVNFDGKIDHVAIFDYALSSSQVTSLYGNSTDGVGNPMAITGGRKPIAYYPIGDYAAFNGSEYLVNNGALQDYVFAFEALNDVVSFGDVDLGPNNFTFSFWFKHIDENNTYGLVAGKTGVIEVYNFKTQNRFFGYVYDDSGGSAYFDTGDLTNENFHNWNLISIVYDGSNVSLYVNGVSSITPVSLTGSIPNNSNNLELKGKSATQNWQLSNISLFDTALPATGTESITSLYNYGTPPNIASYSNLQGWWKLDASATFDGSNFSIPDDSSNSNTGTSSGMTAANLVQSTLNILSPYSRYALNFDGTDNEINFSSSIDLGLNNSVSAWVNLNSGYSGALFGETSYGSSGYFLLPYSTGFIIRIGNTIALASSYVIPSGSWQNMTVVRNASSFLLYLNGAYIETVTLSSTTNTKFDIIGNSRTGADPIEGSLSNVSAFNTALTSAQVTELYNLGKPGNLNNHSAYSNLVSWWQLGENSSFNTNWTVLNEISTGPNGVSANMTEADLVNGVGQTASGVSSGMGGADNIIGDAPYSTANAVSYGMGVDALSTSVPS